MTSCIRAFNRASAAGGFKWGDTRRHPGLGADRNSRGRRGAGNGRGPRHLRRRAGGAAPRARAQIRRRGDREHRCDTRPPEERIDAVREIVGGFGADLVMDCSGHPSAGPEGIEFLRDGGAYVEMGQFTDAGKIETSWHRICAKDLNVIGSWAFTGNDLPLGVDMLYRARDKYPFLDMQTLYPFTEDGVEVRSPTRWR